MLADEIREFVFKNYIKPSREEGKNKVKIRAGDVHEEMELSQRLPAVCGALGTEKFEEKYNVNRIRVEGPANGANTTYVFQLSEINFDSNYSNNINDIRNPPDSQRLGAFKRGWENAVNGELYKSIKNKRTHANMGNLFGWIYGECSDEVKEEVWEQYIENNIEYFDKEWKMPE